MSPYVLLSIWYVSDLLSIGRFLKKAAFYQEVYINNKNINDDNYIMLLLLLWRQISIMLVIIMKVDDDKKINFSKCSLYSVINIL